MVIKIDGKSFGSDMAEDNRALKVDSENIFRVKVNNEDFNELSQALYNNRLKSSGLEPDKYNLDYEIDGKTVGRFDRCSVINVKHENETNLNSQLIIDFMFEYVSYYKSGPKYNTVDIEVPDGKKLVRTEMEFGVLFTYIDDFTVGETVYVYHDNNVFKTKVINVLEDESLEVYIDKTHTIVIPIEEVSRTLEIIDLTK